MKNYYADYGVREICHKVKQKNRDCILEMANSIFNAGSFDTDSVLIPVPQHSGVAEYTKEIARLISKWSGACVADILRRKPGDTRYNQKQAGKDETLSLWLTRPLPKHGKIYLVDNVVATGLTIHACRDLVGDCGLAVFAVDQSAGYI